MKAVDETQREAFRAHYLTTGSVPRASKAAGIAVSTGYLMARKLQDDESFVSERKAQRTRILDEVERALASVVETAAKRYLGKLPMPIIPEGNRAPVNVIDKRPEYGKLVIDAHKAVVGRMRLDAERNGEVARNGDVAIKVVLAGSDEATDKPDKVDAVSVKEAADATVAAVAARSGDDPGLAPKD